MCTQTHLFHFPNRKYHTGLAHRGWLALTTHAEKAHSVPLLLGTCPLSAWSLFERKLKSFVSKAQNLLTRWTAKLSRQAWEVMLLSGGQWWKRQQFLHTPEAVLNKCSVCCGCVSTAWSPVKEELLKVRVDVATVVQSFQISVLACSGTVVGACWSQSQLS